LGPLRGGKSLPATTAAANAALVAYTTRTRN